MLIDTRKWKAAIKLAAVSINAVAKQMQACFASYKEMNEILKLLDKWGKEKEENLKNGQ